MRRKLFNLSAALSLVLLVLVTTWGVRGRRPRSQVATPRGGTLYVWPGSEAGKVEVDWIVPLAQPYRFPGGDFAQYVGWTGRVNAGRVDFEAGLEYRQGLAWEAPGPDAPLNPAGRPLADVASARSYALVLPYWLLSVLTIPLPALWLRRASRDRRAARRAARGRCMACGYDLRGTPSRCPECGTACEARSAAAA
jgi:hypothetical protein